jgi:hypothetical protein
VEGEELSGVQARSSDGCSSPFDRTTRESLGIGQREEMGRDGVEGREPESQWIEKSRGGDFE